MRPPCLFCDRTYLNADTIVNHCKRDHDPHLNSVQSIYGITCPGCGNRYERLGWHATNAHRMPLSHLFAIAERDGDPHGIVAERLNKLSMLQRQRISDRILGIHDRLP